MAPPHWQEPKLEQFMKKCSPEEGCTLEKFMENCLLWGQTPGEGEKGTVETMYLTTTYSLFHCIAREEEVEKMVREVKPRKKVDLVGIRCLKIWVYFSLSYSDLLII